MNRFFTYEEYGAHWTTMSQDLTTMCKGLHGWQEYERGVEALQKVVASENNRDAGSKKALSFSDLLIKVRPSGRHVSTTKLRCCTADTTSLQVPFTLRGLVPPNASLRRPGGPC